MGVSMDPKTFMQLKTANDDKQTAPQSHDPNGAPGEVKLPNAAQAGS